MADIRNANEEQAKFFARMFSSFDHMTGDAMDQLGTSAGGSVILTGLTTYAAKVIMDNVVSTDLEKCWRDTCENAWKQALKLSADEKTKEQNNG